MRHPRGAQSLADAQQWNSHQKMVRRRQELEQHVASILEKPLAVEAALMALPPAVEAEARLVAELRANMLVRYELTCVYACVYRESPSGRILERYYELWAGSLQQAGGFRSLWRVIEPGRLISPRVVAPFERGREIVTLLRWLGLRNRTRGGFTALAPNERLDVR